MKLEMGARALWGCVTGDESELRMLTDWLDGWSRDLDPRGTGRPVYLWKEEGLMVLGGALVMLSQGRVITARFPPVIEGERLVDKVGGLIEARLLREYQAVSAGKAIIASAGRGVIDMAMGGGKTHVAAAIAALGASYGYGKWLYLVRNKELAAQSGNSFRELLPKMCEVTGAIGPRLEATTYAGVERLDELEWDGVIVDECQDLPAPTRARGFARAKAFWRLGLSGTPLDRQDAGNALMLGMLGPVVYTVSLEQLTEEGYLSRGRVQPVVWDRDSRRVSLPSGGPAPLGNLRSAGA